MTSSFWQIFINILVATDILFLSISVYRMDKELKELKKRPNEKTT